MTLRAPTPGTTHAEWLRLVEPSGPFLTVPILLRAFPNGVDRLGSPDRADLRGRLAEVQTRPEDPAMRTAWTEWILRDLLKWGPQVRTGPAVPETLSHVVAEHHTVLRPTHALVEPPSDLLAEGASRVRATVWVWPLRTILTSRITGDTWAASPVDRAALACRAVGVPIALVTNGFDWVLVWAEQGRATGWATFPAHLFGEEPLLAEAFVSICGARRFLSVAPEEQLEQLLVASASAQAEVTGQLGSQVRRAAELLVNALGNADRQQDGTLLAGITGSEVYGAAVAVLMRLVVLFSAEEKGLLPLGDDLYDRTLAASTLLDELATRADRDGDEPLERSATAWHRLLALFRAVHGGISHDRLRIPPYGGALFDPDRHPFLEGRPAGTTWRTAPAQPIPVDDLTVLAILRALQELEMKIPGGGRETRRLSYRSLDVEQIGHVYEGLLDHSAVRAATPVLGLIGKEGLEPEIEIGELVRRASDRTRLLAWLKDTTKLSERRLAQAFDAQPGPDDERRLAAACDNDTELVAATRPWWGLLRPDLRGMPQVIADGSLFVTQTGAKRDSGTAYTTRELADELVEHALAPLCYEPGPATEADPTKWKLKTAQQLLELRICDPAVGSGAILVAACRYLGARLVEAWTTEGTADTYDAELVEIEARRRVVERCLYGVDRDPMAVEMAKLSLWLVTMAKDRPFTFLDHAIRQGDSLLGVTDLEQLRWFHLDPQQGRRLHGQGRFDVDLSVFDTATKEAVDLRRRLAEIPVNSVRDAELKADLAAKADARLADLTLIGDLLIGAALDTNLRGHGTLDQRVLSLQGRVAALLGDDAGIAETVRADVRQKATTWLNAGRPSTAPERHPLHWCLAFPEIFLHGGGFEAIVGNPPFLGGKRLSGAAGGDVRDHLIRWIAQRAKGSADLAAYFFLRATEVGKSIGFLATNSISQGDTREVGLDALIRAGWTIHRAVKSRPWPGIANLEIAQVWAVGSPWVGALVVNGERAASITAALDQRGRASGNPSRLAANARHSFIGSFVLGMGFTLTPEEAYRLIRVDVRYREVLFPFVNGEDLTSSPSQEPSRWVINFFDWPEEKASQYSDCYSILDHGVRPERQRKHEDGSYVLRKPLPERWWQYADKRPALYAALKPLDQVLAIALTSKVVQPVSGSRCRACSLMPADCLHTTTMCISGFLQVPSIGCGR